MLLSKQIVKLPKTPIISPEKKAESPLSFEKSAKVARCRFKQIPQHHKFSHTNPLFPLLGDLPLMRSDDGLITDISLYNEFKTYRHIVASNFCDQKIIAIRPNPKSGKIMVSQSEILEQIAQLKSPENEEWAKIIKVFYQKYDKVMKRQSRKKTKCDVRKKFYVKITSKTEEKKKELFTAYPCLELQFRLKNHQSQLNEIIFDEKFIKELGYSIDSFISNVLNEGIPQLMTADSAISSNIKSLVQNYFQIDDDGFVIPECQATLIMKNGYVKKIKYQMHVMMNYETNTFGMDVVLAIISKEEPYLTSQTSFTDKINDGFIQEMIAREKETDYFLSVFYDQSIQRRYTNIDKICSVKEIESEEH